MKCDGDGDLLTFTLTAHGSNFEHFRAYLSQTRFPCQTPSPGSCILTIPGTAQMNVKGVFAAGDVQNKRYRQGYFRFFYVIGHEPPLFASPSRPGRQYINYTQNSTDERKRRVCCR